MRAHLLARGLLLAAALIQAPFSIAADAPPWMRALTSAPLPAHDDETNAVVLHHETVLTVQAPGKIKRLERKAYKILRRDGEYVGLVRASFDSQSRITLMRAWSLPATGKPYEAKEKDIVETSVPGVEGGELVTDVRTRILQIPAAVPGSIVGYELEQEVRPYDMTDEWEFQDVIPVREARYIVQAPPGWSYKTFWLNHPETQVSPSATGQWAWSVSALAPVKIEQYMPPWRGIAGRMVLSLQPPPGQQGGFRSWQEVGAWYSGLTQGRREATPQIKLKVQEITSKASTQLAKMQALASYVQRDIRYVAIELGIGGLQPNPAASVFTNRYGDCKDKVTLLSSMLKEIGIDSHYLIIHTQRGSFTEATPPNLGFNHAILAVQLPADVEAETLPAVLTHPTMGRVLFFDPTSPLIPFGHLPGYLQANYGMLVTPAGGELLKLPQPSADTNGVRRTAKLALDETGKLSGDVVETWSGDGAAYHRYSLRAVARDVDQIKPIESMLAHSLGTFEITKASIRNLQSNDKPLEWHYSLDVPHYAKAAGDLLLVRPRVIGELSSSLLETKELRVHSIEFEAPTHYVDVVEITLPSGFEIDELPPPVSEDLGFVSYKSAAKADGRVLRYERSFELKELSVPVAKADLLKKFFRDVANDERMSAVLKRGP